MVLVVMVVVEVCVCTHEHIYAKISKLHQNTLMIRGNMFFIIMVPPGECAPSLCWRNLVTTVILGWHCPFRWSKRLSALLA